MNKRKTGFNYMHTHGSQMTEASPRLRRARSSELLGSDGDKLGGWGERRKPTLLCRECLSTSVDHSYPQSISSLVSRLLLLQSPQGFFPDENLFLERAGLSKPCLSLSFLRITSLRFPDISLGVVRSGPPQLCLRGMCPEP